MSPLRVLVALEVAAFACWIISAYRGEDEDELTGLLDQVDLHERRIVIVGFSVMVLVELTLLLLMVRLLGAIGALAFAT